MADHATQPPRPLTDAPPAPPGVVWLPSEQVVLLLATLPPMSTSQRRTAVAFAVEDRIAQPIEAVNVVLGPVTGGKHLVAVAAREEIAALRTTTRSRLVPDVLALPCPSKGWSLWTGADRALVRLADGTGFAVTLAQLPLIWHHAGEPEVTLFGDGAVGIPTTAQSPLPPFDRAFARFDMAAGADASGLLPIPRGAWALAAVLVIAAALHLGVIWADLAANRGVLAGRQADLRSALTAGGRADTGDLEADLTAALRAAQPRQQSGFLPLMADSSAALGQVPGVTLQGLAWGDNTLRLDLQAPDLGGLQAAQAALTAAGIAVQVGSATSGDGMAKVQMTLQVQP